MAKSRRKVMKEITDFFYSVSILIGLYFGYIYKNLAAGFLAFLLCSLLIFIGINIYKYFRNMNYINSGINKVDKMSGEEFEEFLAAHFINLGYKIEFTPTTKDFGADLIIKKDTEVIAIQAKRWSKHIGIEAVQQIVGAIKHYKANKGMVITNCFFTKSAVELANSNEITLWNRNKLIEVMKAPGEKSLADDIINKKQTICPKCGGKLIIRDGKYGKFLGCSSYPKCNYTKNIG